MSQILTALKYEPQCEKVYCQTWAANEDFQGSLIEVFIVWKESCILGYPKCTHWRFWSDCTNAQTDLNLHWADKSEGVFSDVGAHIQLFGHLNLYHFLGIFSRQQIDDIFLIFPRKHDLTLHANCLLRRQFAWNVISCFLEKIRKMFQNVVCWKFYPEC